MHDHRTGCEEGRIAALEGYEILDTLPERAFDDLARMAASICEAPMALVSFVDARRQWFKAQVGVELGQTPVEVSFCSHAIRAPGLMVVPDAQDDARFAANPLVTAGPGIRFYAGAPLMTPDGHALGTICVIDRRPRDLRPDQREALLALGRLAVDQLELRRQAADLARSERALLDTQVRLSLALQASSSGYFDWDIGTGEVYYSEGFDRCLGCTLDPTVEAWQARLHPDDRGRVLAALDDHLGRREPYDVEYRLEARGGVYRWFRARGQAVWDPSGRPIRMGGSISDVTDRRRTEQELRMLKAALDNANDAILITEAEPVDQPGPRVIYVNAAFTRATGYAAEEILGKTPRILQGPGTDQATLADLKKKLKAWRPARVELLNYKKGGAEFWVELNIRPIADERGWYTHWVSIQRDITNRKRAELELRVRAEGEVRDLNTRLEHRIHRLDALRQVDLAISGSLDLRLTLGIILDQILAQLRVDAAAILLVGPHDHALSHAASKGFRTDGIAATRLRPGQGHAGRAILDGVPVCLPDLARAEGGPLRGGLLAGEGFMAYHAIPLVAKGIARGVLEVYHRAPLTLDGDSMAFFEALAGQAGIAVDNATLFRDLQRSNASMVAAYDATIEGWARALDLRDKETEGHTRRVTEMTLRLAREMGVEPAELVQVRRGALLHDIGKLGIPDAILLKPGELNDEERAVMRRHPEYAFEWLSPVEFLRPALDIPYCHHERWDGTGYPRGIAGEQIPRVARIFAAVDIWDALRSDRPYRRGWPERRVVDHLLSLAGTHLDPAVVAAFLQILGQDAGTGWTMGTGEPADLPVPLAGPRGPLIAEGGADAWVAIAAESVRRLEAERDELMLDNARLVELSSTDDLTGLGNRRRFRRALESAFSQADRDGRPLSLVMMDVDHFKAYNDAHGHRAGDEVLRSLAAILRGLALPCQMAARWGGEEFALLLPGADAGAARSFAERLRASIAARPWPIWPVSSSFGIATCPPHLLSASDLLDGADEALYHSKRTGRDRVTHREDLVGAVACHG